jgi:hypothetical protein
MPGRIRIVKGRSGRDGFQWESGGGMGLAGKGLGLPEESLATLKWRRLTSESGSV